MTSATDEGKAWTEILRGSDDAKKEYRASARALRQQYRGLHALSHFNKLYMTERNIESTLASERLEAAIKPGRPELAARARAAQSYLNWNVVEADTAWERNRALVRARIDGVSFLQCQWLFPFVPQVVEDRAVAESQRKGRSEDAVLEALQEVFPGELVGRDIACAELRDSMDVLLPQRLRSYRRLPWTAVRTWLTRADAERLQSSGFWKPGEIHYAPGMLPSSEEFLSTDEQALAIKSLMGDTHTPASAQQPEKHRDGRADPHEIIEVWEIVWRSRKRILHVIPGHGIVRDKPFTLPVQSSLLVPLSFTDDSLDLWALPDARQYLGLQRLVDGIYDSIIETARCAKVLIAHDPDADSEELTKMANAYPNTFVRGNPQAFREIQLGQISNVHFQALEMALSAMTEMGGATGAHSGVASSPVTSATEQNIIMGGFTGRMKHAARFVTRTDRQVLQRFLDLAQALLPPQTLVPLLGQEAMEWEQWQRELQGVSLSGSLGSQFLNIAGSEAIQGEMSVTISTGAASDVQNALEKREVQNVWNLTTQALVSGWDKIPSVRAMLETLFERHGINARHVLGQTPPSQSQPLGGAPGAMVPPGRGQNGGVALSGSSQNRQRGPQGMQGPAADLFGGQ